MNTRGSVCVFVPVVLPVNLSVSYCHVSVESALLVLDYQVISVTVCTCLWFCLCVLVCVWEKYCMFMCMCVSVKDCVPDGQRTGWQQDRWASSFLRCLCVWPTDVASLWCLPPNTRLEINHPNCVNLKIAHSGYFLDMTVHETVMCDALCQWCFCQSCVSKLLLLISSIQIMFF